MNYQTDGRMMQLYRGKFKSNGNCGYVLKPNVMCEGIMEFTQLLSYYMYTGSDWSRTDGLMCDKLIHRSFAITPCTMN